MARLVAKLHVHRHETRIAVGTFGYYSQPSAGPAPIARTVQHHGDRFGMLGKLLAIFTRRERFRVASLTALLTLGALAETIGIGAVFPFMSVLSNPAAVHDDARIRRLYELSGAGGFEEFILLGALGLMVVFLAKNLLLGAIQAFQASFAADLQTRLAADLFAGYMGAPYSSRLERSSAEAVRVIASEVGRATSGVLLPAIGLLTEALVVAGLLALLVAVDAVTALGTLLCLGAAGYLLQRRLKRQLAPHRERGTEAHSQMYRWVSQGLGALKETKVLGREGYFIGRFNASNQVHRDAARAFSIANALPRLAVETAAVWVLLGALIIGITGGRPIAGIVPVMTLFALAAARMMPSATRMLAALNSVRFHFPAVEAVSTGLAANQATDQSQPEAGADAALPVRSPMYELYLDRVVFRYPGDDRPALSGVSLRIRRGEMLALVGRSGSGKTTLSDVLLGLLDPQGGTIHIDGREVASLRREWHGAIGLVPQHFHLLDDTVRRNVAFGLADGEIRDDRVWTALEQAKLANRVRLLPGMLDAVIRENGAVLSGGERQRLAIARALYEDPSMLVLDEATSALDVQTEAEIVATLRLLAKDRAVVLVTHRLANLPACDRIVLMQEGSIVADGSLAQLSAASAEFHELARHDEA